MPEPFKDHFSQTAASYAAQRPRYPAELARYLAELAPRKELAWDAGCGSGQMSLLLGRHFHRVIATDASAEQLAHAAHHVKVTYVQARAEQSGLTTGSADLAVSAQAAHWFDLPEFFAEVKRVLRPGGAFALIGYGNMNVAPEIDQVVWHFYDGILGSYWPSERKMVEDGYRSLNFPFHEIQAPAFEMKVNWSLDQVLGYIGTWSAVWRIRKERGSEALEEFRQQLTGVWGDPRSVRSIVWPLALRVGLADQNGAAGI